MGGLDHLYGRKGKMGFPRFDDEGFRYVPSMMGIQNQG